MILGEKIKKAIEESGIPIRQVAIGIGMSEQNLHKVFKRDSLETKTLKKICELLSLSILTFLSDDESISVNGSDNQVQVIGNNGKNTIKIQSENELIRFLEKQLEQAHKELAEKNKQIDKLLERIPA